MSFENLDGLRKWVVGLLIVYLAISVVGIGSGYLEIQLLGRMEAGDFATQSSMIDQANANDSRQATIGMAEVAAYLVSGIVSLVWVFRVARNAKYLEGSPQKFSPGWAVGWYFIPVATLWKPFQAMAEIWRRSAWPVQRAPDGLLGWWWTLWIGSNAVGQIYFRVAAAADDIGTLTFASYLGLLSELLTVALIIVFLRLVNGITDMQIAKQHAQTSHLQTFDEAQPTVA
jgi:hypothetical protein